MKNLTECINRSLVNETKSGKQEKMKILADKLSDRIMKRNHLGDDIMGQKIEVGDIVINTEDFDFYCVSKVDRQYVSVFKHDSEASEEGEQIYWLQAYDMLKINDPENFLK